MAHEIGVEGVYIQYITKQPLAPAQNGGARNTAENSSAKSIAICPYV